MKSGGPSSIAASRRFDRLALDRLAIEIREEAWLSDWHTPGWYDGHAARIVGAVALLGAADRHSLRLMLVGGDGWTFVMHPMMGVATLDEDPK